MQHYHEAFWFWGGMGKSLLQVEILTRNSDLQTDTTPSKYTTIYVFVVSNGRVVQLHKDHHSGDEFLFHLHNASVNSKMLQCYMVSKVLLPVGVFIAGLRDFPMQHDVGLCFGKS